MSNEIQSSTSSSSEEVDISNVKSYSLEIKDIQLENNNAKEKNDIIDPNHVNFKLPKV